MTKKPETQKNLKLPEDLSKLDPLELRIQQEIEEFLRDLTLEFPFPEIFEILRRHEFKDRYGHNVTPFPHKKFSAEVLKDLNERIDLFLAEMNKTFGSRYADFIGQAFRYYTETTFE